MLASLVLDKQDANIKRVMDDQKLNNLKHKFGVDLEPVTIYRPYEEGTRTEVLFNMDQWASDDESCPLLWIPGPPGIGTSTLIEAWIQKQSRNAKYTIGAYYSFSGKQGKGLNDLISSMIVKLIERFGLGKELDNIYEKLRVMPSHQSISPKDLEEFFASVLNGAIRKNTDKPVVLGIDALDECKKGESGLDLFTLISTLQSKELNSVKCIICSRYGTQMNASVS